MNTKNKGLLAGFLCYVLWGILPLFWKQLAAISAVETLANRVFFSFLFLAILLTLRRKWHHIRLAISDRQTSISIIFAAFLLSLNWGLFIWAVNNNYVIEASLGYFINPFVNVFFGMLLFGERLKRMQMVALLLAISGVLYLTIVTGRPPWISLVLAFSFGIYGVIKKQSTLGPTESLGVETAVIFPIALIYLVSLELNGQSALFNAGWDITLLLMLTGVVTAIPLMLFAYGAKHVPLTTMGIMQFMSPTLQYLLGIFVFKEAFSQQRLIGYMIIWLALICYSAESIRQYRLAHQQKYKSA